MRQFAVLSGATESAAAVRALNVLRAEGRLSRVEIAERIGVSQPAVTHAVRTLVERGLAREEGRQLLDRGAPRRLVELVADSWYAVGVQFDLTATTIVLEDYAGNLVSSAHRSGVGETDPHTAAVGLAAKIRDLLDDASVPGERVLGIGLATYGPQDRERGMLVTPVPTPQWRGYPLTSTLGDMLDVPVLLEHDATAAAIGEMATGQVGTTFGVIYMATGIGGAVIVDGSPYRGRSSNAAEVDHITVVPGGRDCLCGGRGCLGAEASPLAVSVRSAERPLLVARLGLGQSLDAGVTDFEILARASRDGDLEAAEMLDHSAGLLGSASVTMLNLFDLDTLVLTGPAFRTAGPLYRERVERVVQTRAANRDLSMPRVLLGIDPVLASARGAASNVLRRVLPLP